MNGFVIMAPAAVGGPPGWLAWAVGGTVITVGTILLGKEVYDATRADPVPTTRAPVIPNTDARPCENCARPYSIRVHAQGTDCGGTPRSTIGAPALVNPSVPFPAAAGVALASVTWVLLGRRQKNIRTVAKASMEGWILTRPPAGFLGKQSFPASDPTGGKRYDTDSFGITPNYIV
jgi:hypothetical protein